MINKKYIVIIITLFLLSILFAIINIPNQKILKNTYILNYNVSNLVVEDADKKIKTEYENYINENIQLVSNDYFLKVKITDIIDTINFNKACNDAYCYGRSSNIFVNNFNIIKSICYKKNINVDYKENTDILEDIIDTINENLDSKYIDNSYYIENNKLIIEKGTDGYVVDKDNLVKAVIDSIFTNNREIIIPLTIKQRENIDIEKIHEEIYKEKQDAKIDNGNIISEVNGIDFDLDNAKKEISKDEDIIEIPLIITKAQKTTKDLGEEIFKDEIARFNTKYDAKNTNRANNIEIASSKINGTILNSGEVFSFNKIVGNRSANGGYKEAAIYMGGKITQGIGGGICQVSTTLYNAALYANLEIVERKNHIFAPHYVSPGMDATVAWGAVDFKFKNNRKLPIKVICTARDGALTVKILGIKNVEPNIEIKSNIIREIDYETIYEEDESIPKGTAKLKQKGEKGYETITKKIIKAGSNTLNEIVISRDLYNAVPEIYLIPKTSQEETINE